jgi:hypothetical protein
MEWIIRTKLSLHRLVNLKRLVQPLVAFTRQNELGRTQAVSDTLEAIAKAVCEIVGGKDLPLRSSVVRLLLLGYSVGCKIPHLRVTTRDVLLHAKESGLRLVFAIVHVLELLEVCLDILFGVLASVTGTLLSFLSTALQLNLGLIAMADVGLLLLDELLGEIEELLEVVA